MKKTEDTEEERIQRDTRVLIVRRCVLPYPPHHTEDA
jgi:hypothetical protein